MRFHDPEVDRILAAADEAAERLRLSTIAYWQHLAESLAREQQRAAHPACPCCHRVMNDDAERRFVRLAAYVSKDEWERFLHDEQQREATP